MRQKKGAEARRTVPGELLNPVVVVSHRDELLPSDGENPSVRLVEPVLVVAVDPVVGVEEGLRRKEKGVSDVRSHERRGKLTETAGR